jgi:hypothetical protein
VEVKAYWICRQEAGLAVVFKCRPEAAAMRTCVERHSNDAEAFAAFRASRVGDAAPALLERRAAALEAKIAALSQQQAQAQGGAAAAGAGEARP